MDKQQADELDRKHASLHAALESLIDKHSLADVLGFIRMVCDDKAEHLATNWQDAQSATRWEKAGKAVSSAAAAAVRNGC